MEFKDRLNEYMSELGCSARELAEAAHISPAAISRYRSGERVPVLGSSQLLGLAEGIEALSREKGSPIPREEALAELGRTLGGVEVDYPSLLANLRKLIETLGIGNAEIARALSFDPSHISRVLSGKRRAADPVKFMTQTTRYLARRFAGQPECSAIAALIGCDEGELASENALNERLTAWVSSNTERPANPMSSFLYAIDSFDIGEFASKLFSASLEAGAKTPGLAALTQADGPGTAGAAVQGGAAGAVASHTASPAPSTRREYFGQQGMKQAELDFLAAAVAQRPEVILMYSDMPFEVLSHDRAFAMGYVGGLAALIRGGTRLRMIHDVSRPFDEMMLGLQNWIPLYMTGQIEPLYLPKTKNATFTHLIRSADGLSLSGEGIAGYPDESRFGLSLDPAETAYQAQRAQRLLKHAQPLMRVFTARTRDGLEGYLTDTLSKAEGKMLVLAGGLPLFTISGVLLNDILQRSGASRAMRTAIIEHLRKLRTSMESFLENNEIVIVMPGEHAADEDSPLAPAAVPLSSTLLEIEAFYQPAQYREHYKLTRAFARKHASCRIVAGQELPFRNIQIAVCPHTFALVSKNRAPAIHFAIEHPSMVAAFARLVPRAT